MAGELNVTHVGGASCCRCQERQVPACCRLGFVTCVTHDLRHEQTSMRRRQCMHHVYHVLWPSVNQPIPRAPQRSAFRCVHPVRPALNISDDNRCSPGSSRLEHA